MAAQDKSRLWISFLIGLAVVLLVFGAFSLAMRYSGPSKPEALRPLPFSAAERAYVGNIQFAHLEMSGFENMLHQKVTFMNGDISNKGTRTIRAADVTVEFYDTSHRVILRETRRIIGDHTRPLQSGETRSFQIGFETIPEEWNHRFPELQVSGLELK